MATILTAHAYTFDDVLLKPQYSDINSRDEVDTSIEFLPGMKLKVPLMSANMQTINSVEFAVALCKEGGIATIDQFRGIENQVDMIKGIIKEDAQTLGAIGTSRDYMERAEAIIDAGVTAIVMDTPHAHNELTKTAIKDFRKKFKDFPLIVGNIASKEAAMFLIHHGVDGLKVGIGPGSSCLTRVNTGSGAPQITAVMEVFDVARNHGISVIADGGIKTPGHFAKAIAAGGSAGYIGGTFAGTDESPSKLVEINGMKYKEYYGSSSPAAKEKRAKDDKNFKEKANRYVEGDVGYTKYHGSVHDVVESYMMGLKSAMSYSGARTIMEFQEKAIFAIITQNGVVENGAHGIVK